MEGAADLPRRLERALEEFSSMARAVRELADYLDQHPEALLRGKKGESK
jgi:paraquat-inducible protein B